MDRDRGDLALPLVEGVDEADIAVPAEPEAVARDFDEPGSGPPPTTRQSPGAM
jgi:hypothetical protein